MVFQFLFHLALPFGEFESTPTTPIEYIKILDSHKRTNNSQVSQSFELLGSESKNFCSEKFLGYEQITIG